MTLDFKKLIRNAIKKEMKIQHFECNGQVVKKVAKSFLAGGSNNVSRDGIDVYGKEAAK